MKETVKYYFHREISNPIFKNKISRNSKYFKKNDFHNLTKVNLKKTIVNFLSKYGSFINPTYLSNDH